MQPSKRKWFAGGLLISVVLAIGIYSVTTDDEKLHRYSISSGGIGGDGWLLWVESFLVNDQYGVPVGNMGGGDPDNPTFGSGAGFSGPVPLPTTLSARWFSFRNQTFYEATTEIDRETRKALVRWRRQHPDEYYNHYLAIGYAGQGYWSAWWRVYCSSGPCRNEPPFEKLFPLFNKVPAQEAPGDPRLYVVNSEAMIRDGEMPPVELPVRPEPGTGSTVLDDYRTITLDPLMSTSHFLYRFVFSDGTTLDSQTQRSTGYLRSIQWPDVNNPPVLLEVWLPDGTRFISRNLRVRYHGYGLTERHYTDENGVLVLDRRFLGLPPHIDFEK